MAKNIVLLYGKQACDHFNKMLSNWSLLFTNADWQSCCFALVTDDDNAAAAIPLEAAPHVQGRIVTLPTNQLSVAARSVFDFVRTAVTGTTPVMLYAICSNSGVGKLNGAALSSFTDELGRLYLGGLRPVFFHLLTSEFDARINQSDFLSALCENDLYRKASFYLLSDTDDGENYVDLSAQWAALVNELGKSIKHPSAVMAGSVYSLGYAALNPDKMELTSIQERAILEQIILSKLDVCSKEDPSLMIWRLLCDGKYEYPASEADNDPTIFKWIRDMIGNSLVLPDEEKRKNNRILGAVYEGSLDPQRYSRHILRFFSMNMAVDKLEEKAEAYFSDRHERMLTSLASLYLNHKAVETLNRLQKKLNYIAEVKLSEFVPPAMEKKKLFEREADYRGRYCELVESKAKEYCYNEAIQKMARIMCQKLERFKAFCVGRTDRTLPFGDGVISHGQYVTLQGKYPIYCEKIHTEITVNESKFNRWLQEMNLSLFRGDGSIAHEGWQQILAGLLEVLKNLLADTRTYLQVVSDEKPTDPLFSEFLNRYLGDTDRMLFFNGGDINEETHYLIDDDLERHVWTHGHTDQVIIVDNDNVERVDRYMLTGQTILDLLQINDETFPYFRNDPVASDGDAPDRVESPILRIVNVDAGIGVGTKEPENPVLEAPVAATNRFSMHLELQRDKRTTKCAVHWQWPPHTSKLMLYIWQEGHAVYGPHPITAPTDRHLLPDLPYGEIRIEVVADSTDGKHYREELLTPGKLDLLVFHLENTDYRKTKIALQGSKAFINEVFIKNTAPNGNVTIYPVALNETGLYENLILQGNTQMLVDPRLKCPNVRVIPG